MTSCGLQKQFVDLFDDLGLTQVINVPTHCRGNVLDLLLTNIPHMVTKLRVQDKDEICSSDHLGVSFELLVNVKRIKTPKRKTYNYKHADWDNNPTHLCHRPETLEILNDFFINMLEISNIVTKKKLQIQIHGGTTFLATPMPKYGQNTNF